MVKILLINSGGLYRKVFEKLTIDVGGCQLCGSANSYESAQKIMDTDRPQIVFTEVCVEGESGIEISERILSDYPETCIYILSNTCNVSLLHHAMRAGILDYLFKPISREKLEDIVRKYRKASWSEERFKTGEKLCQKVLAHDYAGAYLEAEILAREIFKKGVPDSRRELLEGIRSDLFSMVIGMDSRQKNYYAGKYPVRGLTLQNETLILCYLMDLVSEVFRQICVLKYSKMSVVFDYIEKNMRGDISLSTLARAGGISGGYLSKIFRKYYQVSIVDYMHLRKIHMAKYYMASSEMNISDISFLLGYSEAGYFCKVFKKYENITPSSYYKQYIRAEQKSVQL